jgi:hypothetical protein
MSFIAQPNTSFNVAREAWARLQEHHTWNDWLIVGAALANIQVEAMAAAHTNQAIGKRYCTEIGALLRESGLDGIDKATRSRLLQVMRHRAEVEAWLADPPTAKRLKLNHPQTVFNAWKRDTAPESNKKPKANRPELATIWKNAAVEEKRAALEDGGLKLILEAISPALRAEITKQVLKQNTALMPRRDKDATNFLRMGLGTKRPTDQIMSLGRLQQLLDQRGLSRDQVVVLLPREAPEKDNGVSPEASAEARKAEYAASEVVS